MSKPIDTLIVRLDDAMGSNLAEAMLSGKVLAAVADAESASDPLAAVKAAEVLMALLRRLRAPRRDVILQNRDRGTPAMIAQMNAIAAAPDYFRLAPTREFASGTPIVFGNDGLYPAKIVLGRRDKAVAADGRRFDVQYAVVEADDVLTSNSADGISVEEYTRGLPGKLRAIAGNGRLAGLKAAYTRGTADEYRRELSEDDLTGVRASDVATFDAPVLVRIMRAEDVTENIGDISNQRGTSDLSPVEQAQNDAGRIDLANLDITDDGRPTESAALSFIAAMPESERNNLMDGKQPGAKAYDRLMAAAFWKAYGDEELVRLYAQAVDSEIKTIMGGMASAAAELARLAGAGDLDIRSVVSDAASLAVNAKRQGVKLADFAKQVDMTLSPDVMEVVRMFADNVRSAKKIGERLRAAARFAYDESVKEENDMFGVVEKATRSQVLERLALPPDTSAPLFDSVSSERREAAAATLRTKVDELSAMDNEDALRSIALAEEVLATVRILTAPQPDTVVVAGDSLGPFDETPEGKKALRAAAKAAYEAMLGQWVPCPALGADVELRKQGMKKTLSMSADARKLKLIPAIKSLIENSLKIASRPAYDNVEAQNIVAYHTLRSIALLDGVELAVRFIVKEDDKGLYHYDHTVHASDAIFDDAKANGPAEADPSAAANYKPGGRPAPSLVAGSPTLLPGQEDGAVAIVTDSVSQTDGAFNLTAENREPSAPAKADGPTVVDPSTAANYEPGASAGSLPSGLRSDPTRPSATPEGVLDSVSGGSEIFNLMIEGEPADFAIDDDEPTANPVQDTAQLPPIGVTDEGMDRYVALAADGIADLRSVDVFRVIESLSERNLDGVTRAAFAAWIVQKRPDLADEVANALTELEQADVAAMAAPPAAAQPEPTATDPQRAVDLAFLSGVVSGSADQANAD
ncbi:DUF4132 domain-containing protein, partial [Burkholderia ambifaria]